MPSQLSSTPDLRSKAEDAWIRLAPPFRKHSLAASVVLSHVRRLSAVIRSSPPETRDSALLEATAEAVTSSPSWPHKNRTAIEATLRVISDLALQGWVLRIRDGIPEALRPSVLDADLHAEKARIRRQELLKRDEQLRQPSVRRFIAEMEKARPFDTKVVSIFSLMRDGRELAGMLRHITTLPPAARPEALRTTIDPYLQFVSADGRCEHTGLPLQAIWRYFRHTWSNQYTTVPGRTMALLVRDRAAPNHPILGIGAISSPIIQIRERDTWIGWEADTFIDQARTNPSTTLARWLRSTLDDSIADVYKADFFEDELVAAAAMRTPSTSDIERLRKEGVRQRALHNRCEKRGFFKSAAPRSTTARGRHWIERARRPLFRSKRALLLADLLEARSTFDRLLGPRPDQATLIRLLDDSRGRQAVSRLVRKAKADRVGIAMADITVCGAVAPYNSILGGKLVSLLAASPEVVDAYHQRYATAASEIASAMAGRPTIRPPHLVFLGTTSLYGVLSSQYNRARMPAERLGGKPGDEIRFIEIGSSIAFGTSQFGAETVEALTRLSEQSADGLRVNSIFGEGVSPKLRKIRAGLTLLRFPVAELLTHGRHRTVYGVPLARNLREYLLGMASNPDYLFTMRGPKASAKIAGWWRERWLLRRIESEEVLRDMERHSLVRPVTHGARVPLPAPESIDTLESEID